MTTEEAISWLRQIDERYIHGGDEGFDNRRKEAIETAIAVLRAQQEAEKQWISVKDRLPEDWVDVLARLQCGNCAVIVKSGPVWRERWTNMLLDRVPTPWMPLPEPPKEG